MARSAIMHGFLRALRTAWSARREGVPYAELEGTLAAQRLARRDVLLAGAAGAGLAACNLTTDDTPRATDPASRSEIVIVGGGLAGLVCAYRLREAGVSMTVHEATNRVGGRVHTDRETFEGMHCELGGELIDTTHATMLALSRELGVELLDYRDDELDGRWVAWLDGKRYTAAELEPELVGLGEKVALARKRLWVPADGVSRLNPNGGAALDALSIAQWLDREGMTSGALRRLLDAAFTTELGLDLDVSNALSLILLFDPELTPPALYGASDERFHSKEGNSTYVEKLASALPEGTIVTGSALKALRPRADGRVLLVFDQEGKTVEVSAQQVVLTLPFSALRDVEIAPGLLPDEKRRAIREMGYGQNTKVMVGFEQKPWRTAGSNGESFVDLGYQASWETSRLQPSPKGILTNFLGGARAKEVKADDAPGERQRFLGQLETVFPGATAAASDKAVVAYWPGNPWTKGSYSAPLVGELVAIGGDAATAHGNVHFAGEHTSFEAQGYMEGAASSGERAASEVLEALGVAPSTAPARIRQARAALARATALTRP